MKMTYQGQQYDFPDDASFEQINQFLGESSPNKEEKQVNQPGVSPFSLKDPGKQSLMEQGNLPFNPFQEFSGGLMSGISSVSSLGRSPFEASNPFVSMPGNIPKIDPYSIVGTENKPVSTLPGFIQTLGEFSVPGAPLGRAAPATAKVTGQAINALSHNFRPAAQTEKFLQGLGGGTAVNNARRVAETVETSAEIQKQGALKHKKIVDTAIGKKPVETLHYKSKENEEIFPELRKGFRKLNNKFLENKDFSTAHRLESKMGDRISELRERKYNKTITIEGENELDNLIPLYRDLRKDMDNLVTKEPKHIQEEWLSFKKKYKENYAPYRSTSKLKKIVGGKTVGTKPKVIDSIFNTPTKDVKKILGDLPQEGKNYIVYNALSDINPKNADDIVSAFNKIKQYGGYEDVISSQMENAIAKIEKKIRNRNRLSLGLVPGYKKVKNALSIARGK